MAGRFLELTLGDPYRNLAFEEAMLRTAPAPTLRVWENQESVVIGRGQLARAETDLAFDRRHGIPVVRRVTAGGAVYNGPGNLNWTFCVPQGAKGFRETLDAKGVFSEFAALVVAALTRSGAECAFSPPNSIVDGTGKVSGMAAYVSKKSVLCHGTLLFDADLGRVERTTRPREVELGRKYPRSRFATVSNIRVDKGRFTEELAKSSRGFSRGKMTRKEGAALEGLLPKYRSRSWNLGDPFELDDF